MGVGTTTGLRELGVGPAHLLLADACGVATTTTTRCYFNVRSKADISQLNLPHGGMRSTDCPLDATIGALLNNFIFPATAEYLTSAKCNAIIMKL